MIYIGQEYMSLIIAYGQYLTKAVLNFALPRSHFVRFTRLYAVVYL